MSADSVDRGLSGQQDYLGIERFQRQINRAVVGLAVAVTVVSSLLAYRLAVHMVREREASLLANELVSVIEEVEREDTVKHHFGAHPDTQVVLGEAAPDFLAFVDAKSRDSAFSRRLEGDRVVRWDYTEVGDQDLAWAGIYADGRPVIRARQDLSSFTPEAFRSAVVRILIGGGLLAWIAFWSGIVLTNRVVLRLRASSDALVDIATHDMLTGLPNRYEFESQIANALNEGKSGWVMLMDLDSFKEVNDTLGHHMGDQMLIALGERAERVLGKRGLVSRFGGDEFAVWLPSCAEVEALKVANELAHVLAEPVALASYQVVSSASIGLCECPRQAKTLAEAVARADIAMYEAKERRSGPVVYDPEFDVNSVDALGLRSDLQEAIERGDLMLHYMPKKCLNTGRWTSVEALARWKHPTRGWVSPVVFIELAERAGLIHDLTRHVLQLAADQAVRFQSLGVDCSIAVNLSAISFSDNRLPERVRAPIDQRGLDVSALELELTESAALSDKGRARGILRELSEMGFELSLDDFGTGMSSLAYLQELPIDIVKIDRSFVQNLDDQEQTPDAGIVKATISLAHHLGLDVVAEGVENAKIEGILADLGCDYAQGYGVQRPVSGDVIEELLLEHGVRVEA